MNNSPVTSDEEGDDEVFDSCSMSSQTEPSEAVGPKLSSTSSSSQSGAEDKEVTKPNVAIRASAELLLADVTPEEFKQALVIPIKTEKGSVVHKVIKNPAKYKTEMCEPYKKGQCTFGTDCQFAHGIHELRPVKLHNKYKTVKCRNFEKNGSCEHGNNCAFIHDEKSKAEKLLASQMLKLSQEAHKEIQIWMANSLAH